MSIVHRVCYRPRNVLQVLSAQRVIAYWFGLCQTLRAYWHIWNKQQANRRGPGNLWRVQRCHPYNLLGASYVYIFHPLYSNKWNEICNLIPASSRIWLKLYLYWRRRLFPYARRECGELLVSQLDRRLWNGFVLLRLFGCL
jgi:hypothetical protein